MLDQLRDPHFLLETLAVLKVRISEPDKLGDSQRRPGVVRQLSHEVAVLRCEFAFLPRWPEPEQADELSLTCQPYAEINAKVTKARSRW